MIIDGWTIDPEILSVAPVERCVLSECRGACCSGGVWLDEADLKQIVPHVAAIQANLPEDRRDPNTWFSAPEPDETTPSGVKIGTNVVDDPARPNETCCVFLRPDRLCALQLTSQQLGLPRPGLKPLFCALYPIYIEDGVILFDHETERVFDLASCRRACAIAQPLYRVFSDELILLLGEEGYRRLVEAATSAA